MMTLPSLLTSMKSFSVLTYALACLVFSLTSGLYPMDMSKARALMSGRYHVSYDDIRALAQPVFRHRLLANFHAESERISTDKIIDQLLEAVPVPTSKM